MAMEDCKLARAGCEVTVGISFGRLEAKTVCGALVIVQQTTPAMVLRARDSRLDLTVEPLIPTSFPRAASWDGPCIWLSGEASSGDRSFT